MTYNNDPNLLNYTKMLKGTGGVFPFHTSFSAWVVLMECLCLFFPLYQLQFSALYEVQFIRCVNTAGSRGITVQWQCGKVVL